MKILVDTNVLLDVLLDRRPHSTGSAQVFRHIEEGRVGALLCATTITTLDYLLTQSLSRRDARHTLVKLMRLFEIAPVNRAVIEAALGSRIADFEDAVLEQAAAFAGANAVVTRNAKDFARGSLQILDPREFQSLMEH